MTILYKNIPLIFFIFAQYIFGKDNIPDILETIYDKMKLLPYGSTVFFSKNGKCTKDLNTPIFCLVNNSLYKVEENDQIFIFNFDEYNEDIYYELNVLNTTNEESVTCIISYIDENNKIYFLYYKISEINNELEYNKNIFNSTLINQPINKNINCQKETILLSKNLICFYCGRTKNLVQIIFNMGTSFFIQQSQEENINDNSIILSNSLIIFSILKNQARYFLCSNPSRYSLKIYAKNKFPPQTSRLRRLGENNNNNNKFNEFIFICNNKESLLIFSIINNNNNNNRNCLSSDASNNDPKYNYFSFSDNSLSIKAHHNHNCLYSLGINNQKQIFFIELIHQESDSSIEVVTNAKTTNGIVNIPYSCCTNDIIRKRIFFYF